MEHVLRVYHEEMSRYWGKENFSLSFDDFMAEMNDFKLVVVLLLAMPIISMMLNPYNDNIDSFTKVRRLLRTLRTNIGASDTQELHPDWIEIRSRYKDIMEELYDEGLYEI